MSHFSLKISVHCYRDRFVLEYINVKWINRLKGFIKHYYGFFYYLKKEPISTGKRTICMKQKVDPNYHNNPGGS